MISYIKCIILFTCVGRPGRRKDGDVINYLFYKSALIDYNLT